LIFLYNWFCPTNHTIIDIGRIWNQILKIKFMCGGFVIVTTYRSSKNLSCELSWRLYVENHSSSHKHDLALAYIKHFWQQITLWKWGIKAKLRTYCNIDHGESIMCFTFSIGAFAWHICVTGKAFYNISMRNFDRCFFRFDHNDSLNSPTRSP